MSSLQLASSSSLSPSDTQVSRQTIQILPKTVIDRIAAGEVVQRPSNALKELLENALDAHSTEITTTITAASKNTDCGVSLAVADNGTGMSAEDLALAVQRHATSKLHSVDDLHSLQTFGFRGEALASIALVAQQMTVTSRSAQFSCAHVLTVSSTASKGSLDTPATTDIKPCARKRGTTVAATNLFYNLPHRRNKRNDYSLCLDVLQKYAVHYSTFGVGLVCQKKKPSNGQVLVDLNTLTIPAVGAVRKEKQQSDKDTNATATVRAPTIGQVNAAKQTILHIYGSHHQQLTSPESLVKLEMVSDTSSDHGNENDNTKNTTIVAAESDNAPEIKYSAWGLVSTRHSAAESQGSSRRNQSTIVLFVNHRLVDCPALQKTIETEYTEQYGSKPAFVYLSLAVPPTQVDVNVHPTKQHVTLLHLDTICQQLANTMRETMSQQNRTFERRAITQNPYSKASTTKRKDLQEEEAAVNEDSRKRNSEPPKKKATLPSRLVRTSRHSQAGAIEPFLVPTQSQSLSRTTTSVSTPSQLSQDTAATETPHPQAGNQANEQRTPGVADSFHVPSCPLSSLSQSESVIDMTAPGAFAQAAARCTCRQSGQSDVVLRLPRQAIVRPHKVYATDCSYASIQHLRKRIAKHVSRDWQKKMRSSCFVGVVSAQRSLIQCGEELVLINHYQCARELFYQLALLRFAGNEVGKLGVGGIDIQETIAQSLEYEDWSQQQQYATNLRVDWMCGEELLGVSETNEILSKQAAECLFENAAMLAEYFSIVIEKDGDSGGILLTGLPILLDGYAPSPYGLPMFLLRLATEVDWTEERPCFFGVCSELGTYYAELPDDAATPPQVQHAIFPAISTLLVPSLKLTQEESNFCVLTSLSNLYKVFERC